MIKGFNGFNNKLQCTPSGKCFQYEIGKEYEEDSAKCCNNGFHFCENPLDVLAYYPAANDSRYCEVEGDGEISRKNDEDSKVAASKIKIGVEIGLSGLIKAGLKFVFEKVKFKDTDDYSSGYQSTAATSGYQSTAATSGDRSTAATSGYQSTAATSGDRSTAATSGYQSTAIATGNECIAICNGYEGKAKGSLGCWIGLTEWAQDENLNWHIINFKSTKVDGKKIKADTLYMLKGGKFVKVEKTKA